VAVAGMTSANAVTWNFQAIPSHDYASPQSFTSDVGGYTITASGFDSAATWNAIHIFAKSDGGDESGLGITNDPSGNKEIWGTTFIQIDVAAARAAGLPGFEFSMGSTTQNEAWKVFGSNQTGVGATLTSLLSANTTEGSLTILPNGPGSGYRYYDFFYDSSLGGIGGENVLLNLFTDCASCDPPLSSTPLPAALPLFAGGLGFIGFLARRRKRKAAAAA
jgi:hypothetical protein